jgi:hypothetical protein
MATLKRHKRITAGEEHEHYAGEERCVYLLELESFGANAGATIRVWTDADEDDVAMAKRLPHVFTVEEIHGELWSLLSQGDYAHSANALDDFNTINTVADVFFARIVLDLAKLCS